MYRKQKDYSLRGIARELTIRRTGKSPLLGLIIAFLTGIVLSGATNAQDRKEIAFVDAAFGKLGGIKPYLHNRALVSSHGASNVLFDLCGVLYGATGAASDRKAHVRPLIAGVFAAKPYPNPRMDDGATPLHYAFTNSSGGDRTPFVRALLKAGAKVNALNHDGETPLDAALALHEKETTAYRSAVLFLIDHGGRCTPKGIEDARRSLQEARQSNNPKMTAAQWKVVDQTLAQAQKHILGTSSTHATSIAGAAHRAKTRERTSTLTIGEGDITLFGTVAAIDREKNTFTISATDATTTAHPGVWTAIKPARSNEVVVDAATNWHGVNVGFDKLVIGAVVEVLGTNDGPGKPLRAKEIAEYKARRSN